jgi:hypothetical protein
VKADNFFSELKRRNVYKVAVAYLVASWLLIQIATQVFPFLRDTQLGRSAGSLTSYYLFPGGSYLFVGF